MTNEVREPSRKRLPIGGILVLAVVGGAVLLFTAGDMSWNPLAGPSSSTQAMELSGRWLGMRLASSNTPSAQSLGVPPSTEGVVVAELILPDAARALQAGLLAGDVLVGIDGNAIANLTELYTLTTTLDISRPLPVSIVRQGQPLSVILPAPSGATAGLPAGVAPGMVSPGLGGAATFTPTVTAAPATEPMFYCPNDRLYYRQSQVSSSLTCPRCGGPLAR